jgi:transposase-like protein
MPRGYPSVTREQKQEIIARIRDKGERVSDLAKEYGLSPRSVYAWLSRLGNSQGALLELSRTKREKETLLKIVGQLIVDQKLGKKIQHRCGR